MANVVCPHCKQTFHADTVTKEDLERALEKLSRPDKVLKTVANPSSLIYILHKI